MESNVKTVIRVLSHSGVSNYEAGLFSAEEVDHYISGYVDQGFALVAAHYLGDWSMPDQPNKPLGYKVMYILSRTPEAPVSTSRAKK